MREERTALTLVAICGFDHKASPKLQTTRHSYLILLLICLACCNDDHFRHCASETNLTGKTKTAIRAKTGRLVGIPFSVSLCGHSFRPIPVCLVRRRSHGWRQGAAAAGVRVRAGRTRSARARSAHSGTHGEQHCSAPPVMLRRSSVCLCCAVLCCCVLRVCVCSLLQALCPCASWTIRCRCWRPTVRPTQRPTDRQRSDSGRRLCPQRDSMWRFDGRTSAIPWRQRTLEGQRRGSMSAVCTGASAFATPPTRPLGKCAPSLLAFHSVGPDRLTARGQHAD